MNKQISGLNSLKRNLEFIDNDLIHACKENNIPTNEIGHYTNNKEKLTPSKVLFEAFTLLVIAPIAALAVICLGKIVADLFISVASL